MRFESSVILEGSKTIMALNLESVKFESSVILEGSKTWNSFDMKLIAFESSVILEGSKTSARLSRSSSGLRVVLF